MVRLLALSFLCSAGAWAQLTNASIAGKYFAHEVIRVTSNGTTITDQRSISGTLVFDANGGYTFTGTRKVGVFLPANLTTNGTYTLNSIGVVSISNLEGSGEAINARFSNLAIVGSSTETGNGVYDVFAAVPAPTGFILPTFLDGTYRAASIDFLAGPGVSRAAFFPLTIGSLSISTTGLSGIASNLPPGIQVDTFPQSPYSLNGDGRGTGFIPNSNNLFSGTRTIYGSRDANVLLLVPETAGVHGLAVAVRAGGPATNATFTGLYWSAGLRQNGVRPGAFAGTVNSVGNGVSLLARRDRELEGVTNFTGRADYLVNSDGTGTNLTERFAVGTSGNAFVASGVSIGGTNNYELYFGFRIPPTPTPTGPYLLPYGAINTASFAPPANPAAPGQYVDLYGSALAAAPVTGTAPFPSKLGDVQVLVNDQPAPLYIVSPGLIKFLVPQATAVGTATVVAVVKGTKSNTIPLPIAKTAPGIFSTTQNGIGVGAILRQNNSLLTSLNPARRGETIQVFLTGLGAVEPAVADGVPASLTQLSLLTGNVKAYIRGVQANVEFKGLTPGNVSLNQVNIVVPASIPPGTWPLAIETDEAFTDQVDVVIAP